MGSVSLIVWGILYFAAILIIGYYATRQTKDMSDYLVAGKRLGLWFMSLGLMAAIQSGWTWIGLPGSMYAVGYAPYIGIMSFGAFFGLAIAYYALAGPMRQLADTHGAMTMPDCADAIYNSKALRIIIGIAVVMGCTAYLMVQWAAQGQIITSVFPVSYRVAVIIGILVVSIYMVGGGMLASMYTNFLQMIMMLIAAVTVFVATLVKGGGMANINAAIASVDPNMLNYFNPKTAFTFGFMWIYFVMFWFSTTGQPQIGTKFYSVRDKNLLRWSLLIAGLAYIIGSLGAYAGLQVRALVAQGAIEPLKHPDLAFPTFIKYYFPTWVQGFMYVAVLAATMSTAESFLIGSSSALVRDIWQKGLGNQLDKQQELRWIRIITVVVIIVSGILSLNPPKLISLLGSAAWGAFGAAIGPTIVLGLRWRRATTAGAIASSLVGLFFGMGLFIAHNLKLTSWLKGYPEGGIGMIASIIVLVVVSLLTPAQDKEIFKNFSFNRVKA